MSYRTNMPKEFITLDSNQHDANVEQAILDYADVAYSTGYKDVQLVFTPLLLMERTNFHIHPQQTRTKRMFGPGDKRLLANSARIRMEPFNEYDYDYMNKLSATFTEQLTPDVKERIDDDAIDRVKNAAFILKAVNAIPQDPPYDTCPASAADIDPFDCKDLAVVAALYSVSDTRKLVHYLMKKDKFNSADYSMIAAFENHLSDIVTPEEERNARTIFISKDQMFKDELVKAATAAGKPDKAELHSRKTIMAYLQEELAHIKAHMDTHAIELEAPDKESLLQLETTLEAWKTSKRNKGPER
jgi:hypothetical protein